MLSKFLHALLRGMAIYFGIIICLISLKAISEKDYFQLFLFFSVGSLFLVYGFGGNSGVRKFLPWFARAASPNIKPTSNLEVTKMPKASYKIRLLELLGQALMAFSFYEIAVNNPVFPESYQFPYYPWVFLVMGFALVIPKTLFIIKNRAQEKINQ